MTKKPPTQPVNDPDDIAIIPGSPGVPASVQALHHAATRHHDYFSLATPDGELAGLTNLDLATPRGKAMLLAAMSPADIDFDAGGRAKILATNYVLLPDEGTDPETGEVRSFVRTILIGKDGLTYRSTSESMPRRLKAALALWTPAEWAAGILFVITERKSRKTGRTYHDLRVEWDAS